MKDPKQVPPPPPERSAPPLESRVVKLPAGKGRQPSAATARAPGQPHSLWYALVFPQLADLPASLQQERLQVLAGLATEVSSAVSFHSRSLVLEIRSSLRYFGGIERLHATLLPLLVRQLDEWGLEGRFLYGAAPTPAGSLLLARSGHKVLVHQRDNLRSALGRLSTDVLELEREQRRRLHNMGVRQLRDLWRLPVDGLRKRFGSDFVNLLHQALGKAPEPLRHYQPPPAFSGSCELPCEVENVALLLPVVDELIFRLVDFLRRRDLSTSRLRLSLLHEHRQATEVILGLRHPGRDHDHLMSLLATRLGYLSLPAGVTAVGLTVLRFDAYTGKSGDLPGTRKPGTPSSGNDMGLFMEQLHARLGESCVKRVAGVAEHGPEYASLQLENHDMPRGPVARRFSVNPRPLWLLPEPRELQVRHGRLYHQRRALEILSGPERIETRWWSGADLRRDYYIAREEGGSRLWIYHEKSGHRRWLLHGIFA